MIKKEELVKKITKELDINDIPKEEQENIIVGLGENVLKRLVIKIFDEVPKENHEELKTILNSGDMDTAYKFLNEKISNFDDLVSKNIKDTVAEFKKLSKTI
jgi:hypothetical protein